MDEVNANNRDGGCLSRKGYKNLGDKFTEKTEKKFHAQQLLLHNNFFCTAVQPAQTKKALSPKRLAFLRGKKGLLPQCS
jgi:hypothetical protein